MMPNKTIEANAVKEFFQSERGTYVKVFGGIAVAGAVLVGLWGESAEEIPRNVQEQKLLQEATEIYNDASIASKYSISFTDPLILKSTDFERGGNGISEALNTEAGYKKSRIRVGRSCLSETAYDINQNPNGAAALQVEGDEVSIYPVSGEAKPLEFSLQSDGVLKPVGSTAETLIAYNCRYLGDVPVRSTFNVYTAPKDWTLLDPLTK